VSRRALCRKEITGGGGGRVMDRGGRMGRGGGGGIGKEAMLR